MLAEKFWERLGEGLMSVNLQFEIDFRIFTCFVVERWVACMSRVMSAMLSTESQGVKICLKEWHEHLEWCLFARMMVSAGCRSEEAPRRTRQHLDLRDLSLHTDFAT